jgi:acyl carrier protein
MEAVAQDQVLHIVRTELARICGEQGLDIDQEIGPGSSLVGDVGLDSLSMVEALVAIEQALGIGELSLAAWTDEELEREGPRFTVASLVEVCRRHLSTAAVEG